MIPNTYNGLGLPDPCCEGTYQFQTMHAALRGAYYLTDMHLHESGNARTT